MKETRRKDHTVRFHLHKTQNSRRLIDGDRSQNGGQLLNLGGFWSSSNTGFLSMDASYTSMFTLEKHTEPEKHRYHFFIVLLMVDMNALSHIILFYHVIFFTPPQTVTKLRSN